MSQNKTIYFPHFDVIRFLAAMMVAFAHTYEAWNSWFGKVNKLLDSNHTDYSWWGKLINQFIYNMSFGVEIFFLISGFLISYILLEEKKQIGTINIPKFMLRRAFRIWPLYFFLIIISPYIVAWIDSTPSPSYISQIFFIENFHTIGTKQWIYPFAHFWSICVEEHFYIVWPFVIAFTPLKKILPVLFSLLGISILFRIYIALFYDVPWFTLYLHSISRIDVLIIGAIGAYIYSQKPFTFKLKKWMRITLLILFIYIVSISPIFLWENWFMAGFRKYFYIIIISILLLDYNFNPYFKHYLKPKSIFHYFGKVSYGIYMYSNILLPIIIKKILWPFGISNMWIFFFLSISITLLVSIISYEILEKPFLKIGKRFSIIKTNR